jgi:cobalt/nickel transport system permease protein
MHIPDGYLSPQTCAVFYAASTPFWYVALRRVKRLLSTEFLPLISVFAAFSFVIMMFNLPLPGGTTGHAVGVGIATIVLGPWASILAISTALAIQCLLFGDGGVTALGANCFNMAIVGSLTTWFVYRLLANRAPLVARRRVVAAAIAGYTAINMSALFAAVEFGLQPMFFHDAAGVPLYCPYPLSVSIPAMMLGHLTFAGLAELIVTAGVVAYLQTAEPSLLKRTAPGAAAPADPQNNAATQNKRLIRRLWWGLAALLVATPLGILAAGSAWGEWKPQDFKGGAPRGLARLSSIWSAPFSGYSPAFIHSGSFGYIVSAIVGVCLIIATLFALNAILARKRPLQRGFVERTVQSLFKTVESAVLAEELARTPGLLQRLDPRVKVAGLGSLVLAAATVHKFEILVVLFLVAALAGITSRVPLRILSSTVWLPSLAFSGLIALPAIFFIGDSVAFRIFAVRIMQQGLLSAALLLLRVETAATLSALIVLTTPWTKVLRALRFFRVPVTIVVILGMTFRYIFLLLRTVQEMFESHRSRLVGELQSVERRRLAAATVGVLLSRSVRLSSEIHSAMLARGFHGEVYLLDEQNLTRWNYLQLATLVATAVVAVAVGK